MGKKAPTVRHSMVCELCGRPATQTARGKFEGSGRLWFRAYCAEHYQLWKKSSQGEHGLPLVVHRGKSFDYQDAPATDTRTSLDADIILTAGAVSGILGTHTIDEVKPVVKAVARSSKATTIKELIAEVMSLFPQKEQREFSLEQLRDTFAAAAMHAIVSNEHLFQRISRGVNPEKMNMNIAQHAFYMADEMIRERVKNCADHPIAHFVPAGEKRS